MPRTAAIFGAGSGISASFARALARDGYHVVLAARDTAKLSALATETGAALVSLDVTKPDQVAAAFAKLAPAPDTLDVVLFNASARVRGPTVDAAPDAVADALAVTAYGGFLVAQQAAKRMLAQGHGTILLTGASASVKGYAQSATFAMGKFALRGLAQSMARELGPSNIHIAHIVIDGGVRNPGRGRPADPAKPDSLLDPDAIAETYMHLVRQPRSAWTHELELRPWVERF